LGTYEKSSVLPDIVEIWTEMYLHFLSLEAAMNISFVMVSVCLVYKEGIANTPLCKALIYCKYSL